MPVIACLLIPTTAFILIVAKAWLLAITDEQFLVSCAWPCREVSRARFFHILKGIVFEGELRVASSECLVTIRHSEFSNS